MSAAGLLFALLLQAAGGAPQGASISGRVTDNASGQPLPRMVVALVPANRTLAIESTTDNEGRYRFTSVAPGKYAIGADNDDHHATYLRQWFGSAEPGLSAVPTPNVEIAAGESRTDVDIALTRALAIAGHIFDPGGEPLHDTEVYVTDPDGRRLSVDASRSDDLGAYRVYGLRPGSYRVCAATNNQADQLMSRTGLMYRTGTPPAETCYPAIPLLSQDAFNIDIRTEWPTGSPANTPEDAVAPTGTEKTGTMRGFITDKQTGSPLPHATVHLGYHGSTRRTMSLATATGDDGAITISGLAPGEYDAFATATGHLSAGLSDRANAVSLTVRQGEVLQVSAALTRAYAITVRLVDPFDAPVSAIGVGVRSLDGSGAVSPLSYSDDLGNVRMSGLKPGRYVVCAEPKDLGALLSARARQKRDRLLRTCYPSTPTEAESQPITIGNADIDDLELRLVRGRAFSISGTILDASGAPAARAVPGFSKYIAGGQTSGGFEVHPDGRFEITNVQPGWYAIEATTDRETAFVSLRIADDDIDDLVVAMHKTTTVTGRIAIDDPSATPPSVSDRAPLALSARLADDKLPGLGSSRDATVNSDGTFSLEEMFGRRTIDVRNVPPGWYVKAMRYGTKDATDQPVEFRDGGGTIEIVLSNRGAAIAGTVADVIDKRLPRAKVLLFRLPATDKDVPHLAHTVESVSGNYTIGPIRGGGYSIVAVPADTRYPLPWEWDRIAALAALGERVTVGDLDQRTVDLRVVSGR